MKPCMSCKEVKPVSEMHRNTKYSYRCRECNTAKVKRYRQTQAGKEATSRATMAYVKRNHAKRRAWYLATTRLKQQPCEVCGADNAHRHHEDYDKPLDVMWLCPLHHKKTHK